MRKIKEILTLVCNFLNENHIEYVIVGGIAVLFYSNPRTTMDRDYVYDAFLDLRKRYDGLFQILK